MAVLKFSGRPQYWDLRFLGQNYWDLGFLVSKILGFGVFLEGKTWYYVVERAILGFALLNLLGFVQNTTGHSVIPPPPFFKGAF